MFHRRSFVISIALSFLAGCADTRGERLVGDDVGGSSSPGTLATGDEVVTVDGVPMPVRELGSRQPAVAGGTMVAFDRTHLFVGDELTDQVFVVDVERARITRARQLEPGAQPGRVAIDDRGYAHLVLRGTGELVRVDLETLQVVASARPCDEPRGVVFDAERGLVHLACAAGELVSLSPTHEVVAERLLDTDLRDVVVVGDRLFVSRFRSAEVLILDGDLDVVRRASAPQESFPNGAEAVPGTLWRLRRTAGGVMMVHTVRVATDLGAAPLSGPPPPASEYYVTSDPNAPPAAVMPRFTELDYYGDVASAGSVGRRVGSALIVDAAPYRGGWVGASPSSTSTGSRVSVVVLGRDQGYAVQLQHESTLLELEGPDGRVTVPRLDYLTGFDFGRDEFHEATGSSLACASCHPEGGEDGHVWITPETGPRRTQSLLGGLSGTEPFHWGGEMHDFSSLMNEQTVRMRSSFSVESRDAMLGWLDTLPAPRGVDAASPDDARAFEQAGCAGCHVGGTSSDELNHDVGAGSVQTPRLEGAVLRAPYLSDGCAVDLVATLDGTCRDVAEHGVVEPALRERVVRYVRSL